MSMVRITAFVRPHRLEEVKSAIAAQGVTGMTVSEARGRGNHPEQTVEFAGQAVLIALPVRARVEVVVELEKQETVLAAIQRAAQTGEPGDGKIFVEKVNQAHRIRTGEAGMDAL
ncbi:MAG: P-II family nitrogen regulator [Fimbriimonadaceae bacterium]|nr:P-II family nitrogen regulator [Fimbriimonadaceae bacterium]